MISALRKVFRPITHNRRVRAGLCAAFVLATVLLSSAFIATEADHDCSGHDCPTCLELQACVANLQLTGSSLAVGESPVQVPSVCAVETVPRETRAPATTLHSLDVRFDE